ncbi:hypothetical protein FMN50_20415 [Rhodobacterales bacterium]|nr:hypothetical protein FMN50_20415 [Rhodobacterales bacterium]
MPTLYDAYRLTQETTEPLAAFLDLLACFANEGDNEKWLRNRYFVARMALEYSTRLRDLQADLDSLAISEK